MILFIYDSVMFGVVNAGDSGSVAAAPGRRECS